MRERVSAVLAAILLCAVAIAAQTAATPASPAGGPPPGPPQGPPPKPKNLKVLPEDIDHDRLIAIMRGFSGALGVRCTHCHVGQEGDPRSMDFASDDKDEKKTAREMLKMTEAINSEYISKISGNDPDTQRHLRDLSSRREAPAEAARRGLGRNGRRRRGSMRRSRNTSSSAPNRSRPASTIFAT